MKKSIIICASLIGLFSILTAFKVPTQVSNENIVIATNVTDEYETVMIELAEIEKQVEAEMSDQDKLAFTPIVGLVTRSAAVVRATVAATRAAYAITRAASQAFNVATRNSCGQLLTHLMGMAKANKINDSEFYKKLDEFQMYQLG